MTCHGTCSNGAGRCSNGDGPGRDIELPACSSRLDISPGLPDEHASARARWLVESDSPRAPLLLSDTPISFWGGVGAATGEVIDVQHPLRGSMLSGTALAIPRGRGSCSGSLVILELLVRGCAPAALLLEEPDQILVLGAIVARTVFGKTLPIVALGRKNFADLSALSAAGGDVSVQVSGASGVEIFTATQGSEDSALTPHGNDLGVSGSDHEQTDRRPAGRRDPARGLFPGERSASPRKRSPSRPRQTCSSRQHIPLGPASVRRLTLSPEDRQALDGARGEGVRQAMEINVAIAKLYDAESLVDVTQVHLDGVFYNGPAGLRVVEHFASLGARVAVPTTMNALSVDLRRWKQQGVNDELGTGSVRLAEAYLSMGADSAGESKTCAPYLLSSAPKQGEQVAWGESNAVVFANSILGARTQKYPDLLDLCIALTGRAPLAGAHLEGNRAPALAFVVPPAQGRIARRHTGTETLFWPLLGYHVGQAAGASIPILFGLEDSAPRPSDLKALAAAFGTTAAAPMFHIAGITPEAPVGRFSRADFVDRRDITAVELLAAWSALNPHVPAAPARPAAAGPSPAEIGTPPRHDAVPVSVVTLGNPHFALDEFASLASLVRNRARSPSTRLVVMAGRALEEQAEAAGYLAGLRGFGAEIVNDMCWCFVPRAGESAFVREQDSVLLTSSAKYAHYGPGITGRTVRIASLSECVEAAVTGCTGRDPPSWLSGRPQVTISIEGCM